MGSRHFVPYFSPRIIAPSWGVRGIRMRSLKIHLSILVFLVGLVSCKTNPVNDLEGSLLKRCELEGEFAYLHALKKRPKKPKNDEVNRVPSIPMFTTPVRSHIIPTIAAMASGKPKVIYDAATATDETELT